MKRKILTILGLSLLLFSVSAAGGYGETQTSPAWGKIKPTDIRSIIEQLPPGADHILIYVADGEEDAGVNFYFVPWADEEDGEALIDKLLLKRPPENGILDFKINGIGGSGNRIP